MFASVYLHYDLAVLPWPSVLLLHVRVQDVREGEALAAVRALEPLLHVAVDVVKETLGGELGRGALAASEGDEGWCP